MSIAVVDMKEGMIVAGFNNLPPSICTKIKHEKDGSISFRVENRNGSFWGHNVNPSRKIDASTVSNFLRRLS